MITPHALRTPSITIKPDTIADMFGSIQMEPLNIIPEDIRNNWQAVTPAMFTMTPLGMNMTGLINHDYRLCGMEPIDLMAALDRIYDVLDEPLPQTTHNATLTERCYPRIISPN